jgi:hypothetical protein
MSTDNKVKTISACFYGAVMAGLVPAIHDFGSASKMWDARRIRAFTPVSDGLCPGMTDGFRAR